MGSTFSSLSYCANLLKAYDPDRYFICLMMPARVREDLFALFAFNHEIAKTREIVSETQLGHIRLQWWRDALGDYYYKGSVTDHEVVKALCAAISRHQLPLYHFENLIYAREFDLEGVLPAHLEGLINYADYTSTPLMEMAVTICGGMAEAEPCRVAAINYALAGLIRSIPLHAAQGRCYLPSDLFHKHNVDVDLLYKMEPQEGLPQVVEAIAGQIDTSLKTESRFLKASNALSGMVRAKYKRLGYDVFDSRAQIPIYFKELRLYLLTFLP